MGSESSLTYGGQAVVEGVMIRGQRHASVAVRRPDSTIAIHSEPISSLFTGMLRSTPMVRGIIVLIETMALGMKALIYSANVAAEAEGEEISKGAMAGMLATAPVSAKKKKIVVAGPPITMSDTFRASAADAEAALKDGAPSLHEGEMGNHVGHLPPVAGAGLGQLLWGELSEALLQSRHVCPRHLDPVSHLFSSHGPSCELMTCVG